MTTINQWVFESITGYAPPPSSHIGASVDDYETMTDAQLIEEMRGHIEYYTADEGYTEDEIDGFDENKVLDCIRNYINYDDSEFEDDFFDLYSSL